MPQHGSPLAVATSALLIRTRIVTSLSSGRASRPRGSPSTNAFCCPLSVTAKASCPERSPRVSMTSNAGKLERPRAATLPAEISRTPAGQTKHRRGERALSTSSVCLRNRCPRHIEDKLGGVDVAQIQASAVAAPTSDCRKAAITTSQLPENVRRADRGRYCILVFVCGQRGLPF
jgi:hypothetical protein